MLEHILLYAKQHAIESASFIVNFRSPIDQDDEGRFNDRLVELEEFFPSIESPEFFQISFGQPPTGQPDKPVMKVLNEFGRDGKATWSAQFGESTISLSCKRYTRWDEVWSEAYKRISLLMGIVDPHKFIASIDYAAVDKFSALTDTNSLLSKNILKENEWVPSYLLEYSDPRWDFSCGRFLDVQSDTLLLERMEAQSAIESNRTIVSISNLFSLRFESAVRAKDIVVEEGLSEKFASVWQDLHDRNKTAIKSILIDELQNRMGLSN